MNKIDALKRFSNLVTKLLWTSRISRKIKLFRIRNLAYQSQAFGSSFLPFLNKYQSIKFKKDIINVLKQNVSSKSNKLYQIYNLYHDVPNTTPPLSTKLY